MILSNWQFKQSCILKAIMIFDNSLIDYFIDYLIIILKSHFRLSY